MTKDEAPEIMTAAEVADLLRVNVASVKAWARAGELPGAFKIPGGREWRFRRNDLFAWIEAGGKRSHKHVALRYGHAPGYLREALQEWLDAVDWSARAEARGDVQEAAEGDPGTTVEIDGEPKPIRWLLGQLWQCTDALPGDYARMLDLKGTWTYAAAARKIAAEWLGEEDNLED